MEDNYKNSIDASLDEIDNGRLHNSMVYFHNGDNITCYCEADDDIQYYSNFITPYLRNNNISECLIEYISCDGKSNVKKQFNKNQKLHSNLSAKFLYFVDRDLSDFNDKVNGVLVDENAFEGDNVYTTDNYSIENNLVTTVTFKVLCNKEIGFKSKHLQNEEYKKLYDRIVLLFNNLTNKVITKLATIMSTIIVWKKKNCPKEFPKYLYKQIDISTIFKINNDTFMEENNIIDNYWKDKQTMKNQLKLFCETYKSEIQYIENTIKQNKIKYIRGHYLFSYYRCIYNYIITNYIEPFNAKIKQHNQGIDKKKKDLYKKRDDIQNDIIFSENKINDLDVINKEIIKIPDEFKEYLKESNINDEKDLYNLVIDGNLQYPTSLRDFVNKKIIKRLSHN